MCVRESERRYMYMYTCMSHNISGNNILCTCTGQIELLEESLSDAQERITQLEGED